MARIFKRLDQRNLFALAIAGIALRLLLAPISGHPFDIAESYNASVSILKNPTPMGLPSYLSFMAATPAYFYTLVPLSYLYFYLASILHISAVPLSSLPKLVQEAAAWTIGANGGAMNVTNWLYNLLIKTPFILADLGSGLLIYRLVAMRFGTHIALISFALWFYNPMLIWVSAVWGMFDSLAVFFVLLSTYFLLEGRNSFSAMFLAVAIGFKLYPFFLIIPMTYYMLRSNPKGSPKSKLLMPVLSFCATFVIIFSLSFRYLLPVAGNYLGSPSANANPSSNPTLTYGLTYWSFAPFTDISGSLASNLSLVLFVILGIGTTILAIVYLRKNCDFVTLMFVELLTISSVFFSYLRVNEQWFIWLLPSLVLLGAAKRISKKYILALSVLALLYSWVNSLFAAFFVPSSLYVNGLVEEMYLFTFQFEPYRLGLMAFLGVAFSALVAVMILKLHRASQKQNYDTIGFPRKEPILK